MGRPKIFKISASNDQISHLSVTSRGKHLYLHKIKFSVKKKKKKKQVVLLYTLYTEVDNMGKIL